MKKVFVSYPLLPAGREVIDAGDVQVEYWEKKEHPTEDEYIEKVRGVHGILHAFGSAQLSNGVLDAAGEQLRVVSFLSAGIDSVDVKYLKSRGIKLGHTPGVLSDAVAEIAVALMLVVGRRIIEMADQVKNGGWHYWDPLTDSGVGLRGRTVGIVGLGRIGLATAKRLVPFGVDKFLYSSRSPKQNAAEIGAHHVPLEQLLQCSDFVVVCCSLNVSNEKLFSREAFSMMKKTAIFINIARGQLVDHNALVDALKCNTIRGAGLDVTDPEPLPRDHPLVKLKNCVILPHMATVEEKTSIDMAILAAQNLILGLKGDEMPAEYPL